MKRLGLWLAFAALLATPGHAAIFSPQGDWKSLRTDHFDIIYGERQKPLAELYAAAAEKAFAVLVPIFGEAPPSLIPIVLADIIDLTNGSATFLPYPVISVFPALPTSDDSLAHYENWAYEVILHELTHIFSFAPAHGFYTPFKYLFGNVVRPAAIVPRWYMEGLAVEMESRHTTHGRLRAPSAMASLRALALDNALLTESLDRINESAIPTWPYGQRPYLFGSLIWHRLVEEHGLGVVEKLSQRFGRRFPFLLNAPARAITGKTWVDGWREQSEKMTAEFTAQLAEIKAKGEMDFTPVAPSGAQQNEPSISPNGRYLAFFNSSPFQGASIQVIDRGQENKSFVGRQPRTLLEVQGPTRLAWLPNSTHLVVDRLSLVERYFRFRDLHLIEVSTGKTEQLTQKERASEPAVSPSGEWIAFVRAQGGRTELALLNMASRQVKSLLRPALGVRVSNPEFWDEHTLLFIGRNQRGEDQVYKMELASGRRTPLKVAGKGVTWMQRSSVGLLLLSSRTGVNNLYLLKNNPARLEAITNAQTEVNSGALDVRTRELLTTQLTSKGRQLFASTFKAYNPPTVTTPPSFQFNSPPPPPLHLTKVKVEERSFSPWRYLVPRYWIPFVYPVEGGILFQGTTAVTDPVGRHTYALDGTYDSVTNKWGYGVGYSRAHRPLEWNVRAAESNELLASDSITLTHRLQAIGLSSFLPGLSNSWRQSLAFSHLTTEVPTLAGTREFKRLGPTVQLNYASGAGELSKPTWGEFGTQLAHTAYLPEEDYLDFERTQVGLALHWRKPFPVRHFLSTQLKGSYAPRLATGNSVLFGERTIGGNYLVSLINSNYLLRGYPSGALAGRTLLNGNLEYHFPFKDIFRGKGTFPWFTQSLEMTFFMDAATVDGFYYSPKNRGFFRSRTDQIFSGAGVEFNLTNTVAYHLPVTITLGLYYGFDDRAGGGFTPFFGIGYQGHGGVDQSSAVATQLRPASLAR